MESGGDMMSCLNKRNIICRPMFAFGLFFVLGILSPCPQGYAASDFKVVLKANGGTGEDIRLQNCKKKVAKECGGIFQENGKKYICVPPCSFLPPTERTFCYWISETGKKYDPFTIIPAADHTFTAVWMKAGTEFCFKGTIHRNLFKAIYCSGSYTFGKDGRLYISNKSGARKNENIELHYSLKIEGADGWYVGSISRTDSPHGDNLTDAQLKSMLYPAKSGRLMTPGNLFDASIHFTTPKWGFEVGLYNSDALDGASYKEFLEYKSGNKAAGAWTTGKARYSFLSRSQKKIFSKAVKRLSGTYKPVALLGRQTTSGTKYVFLCQKKKGTSKSAKAWYILTVSKNRKNKVRLRSRRKIKPGSVITRIPPRTKTAAGGLQILSVGNRPAALSKSERKVFQKGIRNYSIYRLRPIALLGTQVQAVKNYRFLCYGTGSGFKDLFVVDIHKKAGGECNVVSCRPLYLEKYMD